MRGVRPVYLGFVLLAAATAFGAEPISVPGLEISPDARTAGLGGAVTALPGGAETVMSNPAGLTGIRRAAFIVSKAEYADTLSLTEAAAAFPLGRKGTVGLGLRTFSAGSISGTDIGGGATASFTPNDLVGVVGAGVRLSGWSVGASGKYVRSTLKDSASTMAVDLGVLSNPFWKKKIRVGASLSNLGGELTYDETAEPLAYVFRTGVSLSFLRRVWLSAEAVATQGRSAEAAFGMEGAVVRDADMALLARLGYDGRTAEAGNGAAMGLGFRYGFLRVDYAYAPLGDLGDTHRVSLSWRPGPRSHSKPSDKKPARSSGGRLRLEP
jgi:hypothetical protein